MLSLPLRSLMEAVLSKLCRFIRGLVSDNLELSVIEKTPSHLHVHAHTDKWRHTRTFCLIYTHANLFKTKMKRHKLFTCSESLSLL